MDKKDKRIKSLESAIVQFQVKVDELSYDRDYYSRELEKANRTIGEYKMKLDYLQGSRGAREEQMSMTNRDYFHLLRVYAQDPTLRAEAARIERGECGGYNNRCF